MQQQPVVLSWQGELVQRREKPPWAVCAPVRVGRGKLRGADGAASGKQPVRCVSDVQLCGDRGRRCAVLGVCRALGPHHLEAEGLHQLAENWEGR